MKAPSPRGAPGPSCAAEARLDAPLLLIAAEQSDVPGLPFGAYEVALKALSAHKPHATYVLIPGATHYVQANHPQAVIDAIEHWLLAINKSTGLRVTCCVLRGSATRDTHHATPYP